jgi:hypothetical protein
MNMRSALRLIPLMAIGAVAAFLLAGPLTSLYKTHAVASRPQPSASASIDPHPSPTSCPASLPIPAKEFTTISGPIPFLPASIWINDPLGVHLRSAPTTSSATIATLAQGIQVTADRVGTDASHADWYHVTTANQSGWVSSDLVSVTPIHLATSTGWSLMVPQEDLASSTDPSITTFAKAGDQVPFLIVQSSTGSTLTVQLPAALRADLAPVGDQTKVVQVWNYTVVKHEARVALDTCTVRSAWARPDQGWPVMTSVFVHTAQRDYRFTLFASGRNDLIVNQVLNSVSLS